jgi:hypothetical protein
MEHMTLCVCVCVCVCVSCTGSGKIGTHNSVYVCVCVGVWGRGEEGGGEWVRKGCVCMRAFVCSHVIMCVHVCVSSQYVLQYKCCVLHVCRRHFAPSRAN